MRKIQLSIQLDAQTGKLDVVGPLDNDIICLGMLEKAKRVVEDFKARKQQGQERPAIQVAPDGFLSNQNLTN